MERWRSENQPLSPIDLIDLAPVLQTESWINRLKYEITVADKETGQTMTAQHSVTAWHVVDERNDVHVVIANVEYAKNFEDSEFGFIDCTFDVAPDLVGVYQLLSIMASKRNSVRIEQRILYFFAVFRGAIHW